MIATCGCGRIAFDPVGEDAPAATDASPFTPDGGFGNPVDLGIGDEADPQLSADELSLWVTINGASANSSIALRTRPTPRAAFGPPVIETAFDSPSREVDAAISADHLVLLFEREDGTPVLESRRATATSAWGPPVPALGLEAVTIRSLDLSPNGLVVYFEAGDGVLQRAERSDRASPFGPPRTVIAPPVNYMTVSADELQLFGNRQASLTTVWAARAAPGDAFVEQGDFAPMGPCKDPDIGPSDRVLVIRCSGGVYQLTR